MSPGSDSSDHPGSILYRSESPFHKPVASYLIIFWFSKTGEDSVPSTDEEVAEEKSNK